MTRTRRVMFAIMVMLTTALIISFISRSGPHGIVSKSIALTVIISFAVMAGAWFFHWPTRSQSKLFSIVGTIGLAAFCLVESDPSLGMMTCAAFTGLASYVAFFHSARLLVLTLGTAFATAAVCATRIAVAGDAVMAIAKLFMLAGGMLAAPLAGQVVVHLLSVAALRSSTDSLTGLQNRRGFYRSARELIANAAGDPTLCFSVIMIDLDNFKRINDTQGHSAGDRLLMGVAKALCQATEGNAVVARVGGEEFLIAETTRSSKIDDCAERVRVAITALTPEVTASLGIISVHVTRADAERPGMAEELVDAADAAMYEAKHAGGNQIRHADASLIQPRPMRGRLLIPAAAPQDRPLRHADHQAHDGASE